MPVSAAIGAAALGGAGLQGLWQYNRDNYFFDVPLKQNRQFQLQNIGMARFALFREDLRDLSGLTTDKVQNYFVVNTLKLGFIVTIFFNFDRVDTEADKMNYVEEQINLLFSVTLMTAFFFLLTSIWFSMHAVMLAESITTKMLVQACRIPLPSMGEVQRSATDARHFETDFTEAFRVPFLGEKFRKRLGEKMKRPPGNEKLPEEPPQAQVSAETEDALRCGAHMGRRRGLVGLSILDIIDGSVDPELLADVDTSLEPHLKFYRLIRPTWTGFDLYGKIAMEIGTATLLSGLGYYALFYLRESGSTFAVSSGGWIAFAFLSVLAWYSLVLDLQISFVKHALLAIPMIGAFIGTIFYVNFADGQADYWWVLTAVVALQTMWVLFVCWSGAGFGSAYPSTWRATRYLNVLHQEEGPANFQKDHLSLHKERSMLARRRIYSNSPGSRSPDTASNPSLSTPLDSTKSPFSSHTRVAPGHAGYSPKFTSPKFSPAGFLRAAFPEDVPSDSEASEASSDDMTMDTLQAFAAAFPLLHCLGLMLETLSLGKQRIMVHQARDRLYEAARAAGALPVGAGSTDTVGLIRPFWILLPPANKRANAEAHRLDMSGEPPDFQAEAIQEEEPPQVTLFELLETVRKVSDLLMTDSSTWTVRDMQRFARYGGEPIPGVASFLAQFHQKGSTQTRFAGATAMNLFRIGVLITGVLWVISNVWSLNLAWRELRSHMPEDSSDFTKVGKRTEDVPEVFGVKETLFLPRPWLLPSSMGCDSDGHRLVLGDVDGAFVGSPNSTTAAWKGPVQPCWGAELLSADFGPQGHLWLSTTMGVHSVQLGSSSSSRLCTPAPVDVPRLEKMAIDSVPPPGSTLPAMALSGGRLHALEADPIEGWRLAGTIGAPIKKPIVAMALRAGIGLILDAIGVVHRLDALTGKWDEPVVLSMDYQWKGVCLLSEGGNWLALGRPAHSVGIRELWSFTPPAPWEKGALGRRGQSPDALPA